MTAPTRRTLVVLVPLCVIAALAASASRARGGQLSDPPGDTALRRTDSGNDGPMSPTAVLPDITGTLVRGWTMTTPGGDPFTGSPVSGPASMMRIDVEFAGMLNPPGPLSSPFDPYRFGPSPLYGFIEFDIDSDADTGGQLPSPARLRVLGNLGRFATRPIGVLAERTLESGSLPDRDLDFFTAPYFERSGEDFALSWCGCFTPTILGGDDGDGVFESSEVWLVKGRFFPRAAGYQGASAVFGGSASGMYDPWVTLRWSYSASSDRTTVSLVYPLTPAGAAMLTGQAQQNLDLYVDFQGSHFSLQEALQDIINGAQGLYEGVTEPAATLVGPWAKKSATDFLTPADYGVMAIVGTSYSAPGIGALYVWTDVAFGLPRGDVNGDGASNVSDANVVAEFIAITDGTPADADGVVNGVVAILDLGANFSMFDVVSDGLINIADFEFYPTFCPADWDTNGVVNSTDVSLYLNDWFSDLISGGTVTDYDENGVVNSTDVSTYVNTWFSDVLECSP